MSDNGTTPDPSEATADDVLSANADFDTGLRAGLAYALGQTGFNAPDDDESPRRNLFEAFGWPRSDLDGWDDENWLALYVRSGYAQTVNDKPVEGTWQDPPEVEDTPDSEDQSEFEQAIERAEKNLRIWNYLSRADKAAGIGQHGLLLIGYSDIANAENPRQQWEEPVEDGQFDGLDDVDSLKPILETQIDEIDWGGPEDGERWGKPIFYPIDFDEDVDDETEDEQTYRRVHHSRVLNVPAQQPLDDETLARPRAEPCLNNILDIEKARGAAAEAAFMSANSDLLLNSDPSQVDMSQGSDELRDELIKFFEGQPFLRTQGMDVEQLDGDIQDPSGIVEVNLDEISAVTGIPKTELRGNESGSVSGSEKDERGWFETIEQRRENYNTPWIVRPFIQDWIDYGILPDPQGGMFEVSWPDPKQLSEADEADLQESRSAVLANLAQVAPGVARRAAEGEYIEEGEMPSDESDVEPMPEPDPEEMQAQFDRSMEVKANDFQPELHPRDDKGQFRDKTVSSLSLSTLRDGYVDGSVEISIAGKTVKSGPVLSEAYSKAESDVKQAALEELDDGFIQESSFGPDQHAAHGQFNAWREERQQSLLNDNTAELWGAAIDDTGNDRVPENAAAEPDTVGEPLPAVEGDEPVTALGDSVQVTRNVLRETFGETVPVVRGITGDFAEKIREKADNGEKIELNHRALESWTTLPEHAQQFANEEEEGVLITTEIPVERIYGASHSTPGLTEEENEIIAALDESVSYTPDQIHSADEDGLKEAYKRLRENQ